MYILKRNSQILFQIYNTIKNKKNCCYIRFPGCELFSPRRQDHQAVFADERRSVIQRLDISGPAAASVSRRAAGVR